MDKIKPLVQSDSAVNMFNEEDVKIANRLHPVSEESHLAWLQDEYSFERKMMILKRRILNLVLIVVHRMLVKAIIQQVVRSPIV